MNGWTPVGESVSIVLVGSFNPRIFHPEWFIRKQLVSEWPYESESEPLICTPDLARVKLPDDRYIQVVQNKFVASSSAASENVSVMDIVSGSFSILSETPVSQLGMNYERMVRIGSIDRWKALGKALAPHEPWLAAAEASDNKASDALIKDADNEKLAGLWEMVFNLPRFDDLSGYFRPKIEAVKSQSAFTLKLSTNSHIELGKEGVKQVPTILEGNWVGSIEFAKNYLDNLLEILLAGGK